MALTSRISNVKGKGIQIPNRDNERRITASRTLLKKMLTIFRIQTFLSKFYQMGVSENMDYSKATDEQIKNIIEWDIGIPTLLLKDVFEEAMRRKLFHKKITYFVFKHFKTRANAEKKTDLTIEDLIWICYEKGFENIDRFTPTQPFGAFWHTLITREIQIVARDRNAKKRTGNVYSLEDIHEWKIPGGNHTEPIAINRVYIENIMNQLTDIEKEIVIKRYEGYLYSEIGEMQGITGDGVRNRMKRYLKRIKGA